MHAYSTSSLLEINNFQSRVMHKSIAIMENRRKGGVKGNRKQTTSNSCRQPTQLCKFAQFLQIAQPSDTWRHCWATKASGIVYMQQTVTATTTITIITATVAVSSNSCCFNALTVGIAYESCKCTNTYIHVHIKTQHCQQFASNIALHTIRSQCKCLQ